MRSKDFISPILVRLWVFFSVIGVFLTENIFLIPMPIIIGWPVILMNWKHAQKSLPILKSWSITVIIVLLMHALSDWKESVVSLITFITTIGVIHVYVGENLQRFKIIVKMITFSLVLSTIVLLIGKFYPDLNMQIRRIILDKSTFRTNNITGLTTEVFHFGYQASVLSGIALVYISFIKHIKNRISIYLLFVISLLGILWGMQRAVIFSFLLYLAFITKKGGLRFIIYFMLFIVFLWSLGLFEHLLVGKTIFWKIQNSVIKHENL